MEDTNKHLNPDKSNYNSMSDEELTDILLRDIHLPEEDESDIDEIMKVMEVVVKRKEEQSPSELVDVDAAWKSFQQKRMQYAENAGSLQEEKTKEEKATEPIPFKSKKHSYKWKRSLIRFACVAAVIIAILFTNTITDSAFGYDLWGAVAEWTKDTFGFKGKNLVNEQNNEIVNTLYENNIDVQIIPTWLPEGYQCKGIEMHETFRSTIFRIEYINNDSKIVLTIRKMIQPIEITYEKDNSEVVIHEVAGIKHYIMTDTTTRKIIWVAQEYECNIGGDFSIDDAKQIIDSIYEEE